MLPKTSVSSNLKIGVGKVHKARQRSALELLRTPILCLDKALGAEVRSYILTHHPAGDLSRN